MGTQHREYIRHPSSIPLDVKCQSSEQQLHLQLHDVSYGGLSFISPVELAVGAIIRLKIRAVRPIFKVNAVVQWCIERDHHYELGVEFLDKEDAFRVRMVEQVCHIEAYRQNAKKKSGRRLSKDQASIEWIEKHAPDFPQQDA